MADINPTSFPIASVLGSTDILPVCQGGTWKCATYSLFAVQPSFTSTVATGTAPLIVASTTKVTNLNADQVDSFHVSQTGGASTIPATDANGHISLGGEAAKQWNANTRAIELATGPQYSATLLGSSSYGFCLVNGAYYTSTASWSYRTQNVTPSAIITNSSGLSIWTATKGTSGTVDTLITWKTVASCTEAGNFLVGTANEDSSGSKLQVGGGISFNPATTTSSPAAGGAGALPATPAGYMTIYVNGTARKVPYY